MIASSRNKRVLYLPRMLRAGLRDRELRKFPFCDIALQIVPSILKSIDDAAVIQKRHLPNRKMTVLCDSVEE